MAGIVANKCWPALYQGCPYLVFVHNRPNSSTGASYSEITLLVITKATKKKKTKQKNKTNGSVVAVSNTILKERQGLHKHKAAVNIPLANIGLW